jgi:hypothetical protein
MWRRRLGVAALLAVLLALGTACGSDDDSSDTTTTIPAPVVTDDPI